MATAKVLQKPEIIEIIGSTIRVKHPDISRNARTQAQASLAAAGTTLTVADNNNFEDNDWFIIGEISDNKTEECDVNGAVTRGTSLTITNSTKFAHELHAPITLINERAITIYGAATDGGTGTIIASVDAITTPIVDGVSIQWDKEYTEYTLKSTDTSYAYYYVVFTDGTTTSSASDYVLAAGLGNTSVAKIVNGGLNQVNASIDGEMVTREWLLTVVNDWQDEIVNHVDSRGIAKDWSFEEFEDTTSISATENEDSYALSGLSSTLKYTNSKRALLSVFFGKNKLEYEDLDCFEDKYMDGVTRGALYTGTTAGDTTMTLSDSAEFTSSGSVNLAGDTVTYTTNTVSTGVLSGIPASGAGSITESSSAAATVWQGVTPGLPTKYTIFNGKIILNVPVDEDYVSYKIKVKGRKQLDRLTSYSSTTPIPFIHTSREYIGSRIESRKGNIDEANRLLKIFYRKLELEAQRDPSHNTEQTEYYTFSVK